MQSFLDMAIPGLRCLNPGCQAEAPMGNRITFRQILYDGWTCSYCGWEYEGALVELVSFCGMDPPKRWLDDGTEVTLQEEADAAHLPSRDEMEKDQKDDIIGIAEELEDGSIRVTPAGVLLNSAGEPVVLEALNDMNRVELVAELERLDLSLDDVPFEGKAISNLDIKRYVFLGKQQLDTNEQEQESE